ncbi:hypothetical protein GCM10010446_67370 [Streptomyces enissocaesilis]|uniref:Secreted protein n=1 Tax=Streptomyces enissocaesilis TaxID=332589 RepID=A0ABN3XNU9_9ACTN
MTAWWVASLPGPTEKRVLAGSVWGAGAELASAEAGAAAPRGSVSALAAGTDRDRGYARSPFGRGVRCRGPWRRTAWRSARRQGPAFGGGTGQ